MRVSIELVWTNNDARGTTIIAQSCFLVVALVNECQQKKKAIYSDVIRIRRESGLEVATASSTFLIL